MAEKTSEFKFYVIGAGLPRTGTFTMKKALEILYPGKCMHMIAIYQEDYYTPLMDYVFNDNSSDEEFKNYFKKYNVVAGVDAPFISVYKRAMKAFPDAKVVLTVRDPESWVNSMKKTVCTIQHDEPRDKFPLSIIGALTPSYRRFRKYDLEEPVLNGAVDQVLKGEGVKYFENWVEDVKNTVPAGNLLIYHVKEGWEPLCKFLNLPIPNQPFPKSNDQDEFRKIFWRLQLWDWMKLVTLLSIPIGIGVAVNMKYNIVNVKLENFSKIKSFFNF